LPFRYPVGSRLKARIGWAPHHPTVSWSTAASLATKLDQPLVVNGQKRTTSHAVPVKRRIVAPHAHGDDGRDGAVAAVPRQNDRTSLGFNARESTVAQRLDQLGQPPHLAPNIAAPSSLLGAK